MSNYEKQNFVKGQILKAEHLNHIEDGIGQLSEEIDNIKEGGADSGYFDKTELPGKNLLDLAAMTNGYVSAGGVIKANDNYKTSDFIAVTPGKWLTASYVPIGSDQTTMGIRYIALYDENKVYSGFGPSSAVEKYLIPDDVYFVRVSISMSGNYGTSGKNQIELTNDGVFTTYEDYGVDKYEVSLSKDVSVPEVKKARGKYESLADRLNAMAENGAMLDIEIGKNRMNPNDPDYAVGKFLATNGTWSDNATYASSGYIPVNPGEIIVLVGASGSKGLMRTIAAYDVDKKTVGAAGIYSVNEYVVPDGISYIRVSWSIGSYSETPMICATENGNSCKYEAYKATECIDESLLPVNRPTHCYLPPRIYVAVGRTIELYNNQVCLEADKYHVQWFCRVGAAMERKFTVTGTSDMLNSRTDSSHQYGEYRLELSLWDDDGHLCWNGSTTLCVVPALAQEITSIPIGDSLTNWKAWLQECMLLSDEKITWVGTRASGASKDSEGNDYADGTIRHEGRSGFSAGSYLSNAEYTFDNRYAGVSGVAGTANPFWDGTKFSLTHYLTTQQIAMPSAVQIFLGTNDLADGVETAAENIEALVAAIRSEYTDLPIMLCNTIYRSRQDGYGSVGSDSYTGGSGAGSYQYDEDCKVFELMRKINIDLYADANVHIVPLAICHDTDYNFGAVEVSANPRAAQKVHVPVESVHPQVQGYYQMADVIYSAYSYVFKA